MKFPVLSETPLWLVLVHWYGLLLIALFELLHLGDAWLASLPWSNWPQVLAAGWRSGQLPSGALILLYMNGLMVASAVILLNVFVRLLALNRPREAVPRTPETPPDVPGADQAAQALHGEAGRCLMQNPEVVALVGQFREQLRRISVARTGGRWP